MKSLKDIAPPAEDFKKRKSDRGTTAHSNRGGRGGKSDVLRERTGGNNRDQRPKESDALVEEDKKDGLAQKLEKQSGKNLEEKKSDPKPRPQQTSAKPNEIASVQLTSGLDKNIPA